MNGKVYIGKTTRSLKERKKEHLKQAKAKRDNMYFHRAIRKYGKNAFEWKIIENHEDEDVLNKLERLHISRYESMDSFWGYNLREGSEGKSGWNHTSESKKKMSETKKGKKQTKAQRKKNSKKAHGKGLFGFTGITYKEKNTDPWNKVWNAQISYNGKGQKSLGYFNDPLSCQIVYDFVWNEIYNTYDKE